MVRNYVKKRTEPEIVEEDMEKAVIEENMQLIYMELNIHHYFIESIKPKMQMGKHLIVHPISIQQNIHFVRCSRWNKRVCLKNIF